MEKLIYVTNTDSNDISVVDVSKQKERGRIPIGGSPRGSMAIDNQGVYGYVCNCAGQTVSVIDLMSNREVEKVTVGIAPRGVCLSPNGELAFVANSGSGDVSIVDVKRREEVNRIPTGDNPRFLSVTPNGRFVSVPCWGADSVSIIEVNYKNPGEMGETSRIYLNKDAKPYHALSYADSEHIYTANTHRHTISEINLLDMKIINEIPTSYGPRAVISDPNDPYLYVSCEASNAISVIDLNSKQEMKKIDVGPTPRGLKIDESDRTLYVSNFKRSLISNFNEDGDGLSVVDLNKKERISGIKTGLGPCSVNIFDPAAYNEKVNKDGDKELSI